jgi:hypothetical protein
VLPVTERAKLCRAATAALAVLLTCGCMSADSSAGASPGPVYDPRSRRLVRLDWDANGDGRIEQRTYLEGTVPFRSEVDEDGDGRVDRWEYVGSGGQVVRIGMSTARDGVEDMWVWPENASGEVLVERAQYRDRIVDRREYYRGDVLVRAEEDANRDGRMDKWETWDDGRLREAAFDTTFSKGAPDRRLVYGDDGRVVYVETDADGDGRFEQRTAPEEGAQRGHSGD